MKAGSNLYTSDEGARIPQKTYTQRKHGKAKKESAGNRGRAEQEIRETAMRSGKRAKAARNLPIPTRSWGQQIWQLPAERTWHPAESAERTTVKALSSQQVGTHGGDTHAADAHHAVGHLLAGHQADTQTGRMQQRGRGNEAGAIQSG